MSISIVLDLEDYLVKNLLSSCEVAGEQLNEHIISILESHSASATSDSELLKLALNRVKEMPNGQEFTLKEVMADVWDQIESPRAFGRLFKKQSSYLASHQGVNSSNKAIYKKFEYQSNDYLVHQCSTTIG